MSLEVATTSQQMAAHPHHSAWVAASAGSGKTKVLTDRVLNLLLEGYLPERILCLTFTKAAAAEMANRLRERLGEWAILPEDDLKKSIEKLQGTPPSSEKIQEARGLFGLALDTPGGLKVQTIHSFCQSLLKRFPLEAGLSPFFDVADETEQRHLTQEAFHKVMGDPTLQRSLQELVLRFSEGALEEFNTFILQTRTSFEDLKPEEIDRVLQTQDLTKEGLLDSLIQGVPDELSKKGRFLVEEGSSSEQERGRMLTDFMGLSREEKMHSHESYLSFFLTQEGKKRDRLLTKKLALKDPTFKELLEKEALRLEVWVEKFHGYEIAVVSKAFLTYSLSFLRAYATLKKPRTLLDYEDLILKSVALLKNPGCHWVLYKLDGGLDHILVDEAQDTNPAQWQVIRAIAEEFYANASEDQRDRTLFIVGDEKQSIYSFQGADPAVFRRMQHDLRTFAKNSGKTWKDIDLNLSFRSTPEVLTVVDAVFSSSPLFQNPLKHLPFRKEAPGHVELWPLFTEEEERALEPWQLPLVSKKVDSPQKRLAQVIAQTIKGWLSGNSPLSKSVTPGDILILVGRRTSFVDMLIRTLKDQGVPVAGIDRLRLLEGITVQDLLKIAEFLLLPEDDLTLATVLKGPLFDLSEEDLFNLAYERNGVSLWECLQGEEKFQEITSCLKDLLSRVDYLTPFALFSMILGPLGGRKKWQSRLGPEVLDSLDEFLTLCLNFQQDHIPSLQTFLHWISQEVLELKRDLDQRNQVRVMTVHGSKGLQAPIVFLPDTTHIPMDLPAFDFFEKALVWLPPSAKDNILTKRLKQNLREKQQEEYRRLLYVALTRAEDALYVCGWGKNVPNSWYHCVQRGLEQVGKEVDFKAYPFLEEGKSWRLSSVKQGEVFTSQNEEPPSFLLPQWLKTSPPSESMPPLLRPSENDQDLSFESSSQGAFGTRRGILIHKLLEILPNLPEKEREKAAAWFLKKEQTPREKASEIITCVQKVLSSNPDLFGPHSQGEVPVVGYIGEALLSGQMDRLIMTEEHLLVVDFKTHRAVPEKLEDIPPAYLKQMALYQRALAQIYPQKPILCALLWTEVARLDILPASLLKKFTRSIDENEGWSYTYQKKA